MREVASPSLSRRTTLRLGGEALAEIWLEALADLDRLPERLASIGGQAFCLGRGSNILARDGELPLVLLRPAFAMQPLALGEAEGKTLVRASADIPMPGLMRFCLENGLSGLEGLVGIPGTVGGAVAMNAGSFGTETAACLYEVLAYSQNGIRAYGRDAMQPGYRQMAFAGEPEGIIILTATFALTKASKDVISRRMHLNFFEKKSRQPLAAWSAGSAFKNPGGDLSAGRLLELAGFRGRRLGGMAFSPKHANFLVNEGKGCAKAALELLEEAQGAVERLFGIELEPEIRIIPWR